MSVSQDTLAAALFDPGCATPTGLTDGTARPAGRRFDVYRNNVTVSLTEALHTGFPAIAKLLGKANMDGIARLFLRANPPETPLMMHYGAAFPEFLAGLEELAKWPYLPDVARLELALRRAYHAADTAPIDAAQLGKMEPGALMQARFGFAPAMQVLRSPWPILDIWRFNMVQGAEKPRPDAQDVLITRPDFDTVPALLPAGGAEWITALVAGQTVETALDAAQAAAPDFDLGPVLTLLLQGGALTSISPGGG